MSYGIGYAGAESDYNEADVVIFGIPYDHTSCFKAGAREAPTAIRRASYNFEEIHFEHGIHQPHLNVYDYGNCDDFILPEDMFAEVDFAVGPAIRDGKFTVAMGGEHSINIPIVRNFEPDDIALISIDAHLDSRDEYLGTPNSHACITRRAAEHLGLENVFVLGARAIGEEELDRDDVVPFISSYDIMDNGIEWAIEKALDSVKNERIYLTVDIDGIDPAFAPGRGLDNNWTVRKHYPHELALAATLYEPASGRKLQAFTTQPGVQIYSGNWVEQHVGKQGKRYDEQYAICLEAQGFPNSPNVAHFPSSVLRPGERYDEWCVYRFSAE